MKLIFYCYHEIIPEFHLFQEWLHKPLPNASPSHHLLPYFLKPTIRMVQIFSHAATKARLEIDEKQLTRLLDGEELQVDLDLDTGYVILILKKRMERFVLRFPKKS